MSKYRISVVAAFAVLTIGFIGCGLGNDEGAEVALRLVQEFKPTPAGASVLQMLQAGSKEQWSVVKNSDDMYRVIFHGSASGKAKELVFGVSINNRHVMALNKDALAYTTPN